METKTTREGDSPKTYTATDLAFYAGTDDADDAAEAATDLINRDRSRWADIDHAANTIAAHIGDSYPGTGANDTTSREAIAEALRANKHLQSRKAQAAWKAGRGA